MFNQYTYVYVEDDPLSREIMQMIMKNGMDVDRLTMFEDSADFMPRMKSLVNKPDVILLDIHVKPLDGFEMLALLRADPGYRHVKIVALTASVMNEEIERLRESGFDGAIGKPLSIQTFPDLMTRILQNEIVWYTT